jgi:hypothetical protein
MEMSKATDKETERCCCICAVFTPDVMNQVPNSALPPATRRVCYLFTIMATANPGQDSAG